MYDVDTGKRLPTTSDLAELLDLIRKEKQQTDRFFLNNLQTEQEIQPIARLSLEKQQAEQRAESLQAEVDRLREELTRSRAGSQPVNP